MRLLVATVALCLSLPPAVSGQRLYFGVVGGTALTPGFPGYDTAAPADGFGNPAYRFQWLNGTRSLILGALLEARLRGGLSIEANVLHRPLHNRIINTLYYSGDGPPIISRDSYTAVRAWEFPVLLKYNLPVARPASRFRLFIEVGPGFRTQEAGGVAEPSHYGISAGLGAALSFGRLRIAPSLRYTRWQPETEIWPRYPTKPDQVEFLTSVAYETDAENRRAFGRTIEFGVVAGLPVSHGFGKTEFETIVERPRFLAGLMTQIDFAHNFSLELDAIYKPLRAGSDTPDVQSPFSVLTWQFPVLAKYRWSRRTWIPFAEAGPSFRLSGNLNGYNPSHYGLTAGAGIETRAHAFRFAPVLRYTRWADDGAAYHWDYPHTNPNALELIFGISF